MSIYDEFKTFARNVNVLFVDDDPTTLQEAYDAFGLYFNTFDCVNNGLEALQKYNQAEYDLVMTDINMPKMNGIALIREIKQIHPEQKIIAISAHDESDWLIGAMQVGVTTFLSKPLDAMDLLQRLCPICRDIMSEKITLEKVYNLIDEKESLVNQNRILRKELKMCRNPVKNCPAVNTEQYELNAGDHRLDNSELDDEQYDLSVINHRMVEDYFAKDEDDGSEKVLFLKDHGNDLKDIFSDISTLLFQMHTDENVDHTESIANSLGRATSIFIYYTPYMDIIASSLCELSKTVMERQESFAVLFRENADHILRLFDAVSADMQRYVERFTHESMAMKNIHHIHQPTALSIDQIIALLKPEEVDYGDLEFFI
jgi:YesN/AraC family two-component response regulator